MRVLSLFCGAGGLDWGFVQEGFELVGAFDCNKDAIATHHRNFDGIGATTFEITEDIAFFEQFKGVDVVIGGPPCQGFSQGGKMDLSDPRNSLIFRFVDIVEIVQPKVFVMENVPNLYTSAKFRPIIEAYMKRVEEMGYQLTPFLLNAKDYGVAQSRKRILFIGRKEGIPPPNKPDRCRRSLTAGDVLRTLPPPSIFPNVGVCKAKITFAKNPVIRGSAYSGMLFNGSGRPICLSECCNILPASMGGNRTPIVDEKEIREGVAPWVEDYYTHLKSGGEIAKQIPDRMRRITVTEAKLLQGFPLDFEFCGSISSQYRQIGNSVCPPLAQKIANIVTNILG